MVMGWFDAAEAERFGVKLAEFFVQRIPPKNPGRKVMTLEKQLAVVDKMYLQIEQFKQEHRMNLYKKAKLGNAFKWHLLSAGYEKEFVDQVTEGLLHKL